MLTQAQAGGGVRERVRARAGGRCAKDRATARGGKKNKPRHRRGSCRRRAMTFPSPMVPSWHKKKKKGRFGVGAGLRGQIPDRPPILGGSVGPDKARSLIVLVLPSLAAGPSIHLRSGSYAAGVEILGLFVNSETRHREELQPNLLEIKKIGMSYQLSSNTAVPDALCAHPESPTSSVPWPVRQHTPASPAHTCTP